jgi:hypothetical protein
MRTIIIFSSLFVVSCAGQDHPLKEIGKPDLKEVSGIEMPPQSDIIWALEDSGNKSKIYGLDEEGKSKYTITLEGVKNNDWEDITSDKEGSLYIGDFGNNDNDRKDLAIYKVDKDSLTQSKTHPSYQVSFYFPEQTEFPPKKSGLLYDVEAFLEYKGNFYLFTKNRSAKFQGDFYVYKVPNKPGNHAAKKLATLNSCKVYSRCAITAADISPDEKTIALLSSDKIWLLTGFENDNFTQENMKQYDLLHNSQKEGLCFKDNTTLIIADERSKKSGGYLYKVNLSDLKAKR